MSHNISPTLLGIPVELRYEIYNHLCRSEPVCYPFPNSPITSISHRGPPRALLLTCHKILVEVCTFYYGLATFRIGALASSRLDRDFISPGSLNVIRQAKKVELMMMWNVTIETARVGVVAIPYWMKGWLDQHVELLIEEGQNLQTIIISLRDASNYGGWWAKKELLEPLQLLKGKVRFVVGEIVASKNAKDDIKVNVQDYVKSLNR